MPVPFRILADGYKPTLRPNDTCADPGIRPSASDAVIGQGASVLGEPCSTCDSPKLEGGGCSRELGQVR